MKNTITNNSSTWFLGTQELRTNHTAHIETAKRAKTQTTWRIRFAFSAESSRPKDMQMTRSSCL
jgi:hypothetical protein